MCLEMAVSLRIAYKFLSFFCIKQNPFKELKFHLIEILNKNTYIFLPSF